MSDLYIMFKDIPVIQMHSDGIHCKFKILREDIAPIEFLNQNTSLDDIWKQFLRKRVPIMTEHNADIVMEYITKTYFRQIEYLKNANVQENEIREYIRMQAGLLFHSTSMTDSYWLKTNDCTLEWSDINPRTHELKDICKNSEIESMLDIQNEVSKGHALYNEIDNGATPKIWKMVDEEEFMLYKRGGKQETKNEIIVSDILNHTNLPHVQYQKVSEECCKCLNIANEDISIVNGIEISAYCSRSKMGYDRFMKNLNPDLYNAMQVIDFLIDNPNRSIHNQGCLRDNESGRIIDIQPLFDHNNAFDERLMTQDRDSYEYRKRLAHAKLCLSECNFRMEQIPFSVFQDYEKYKSFMEKACDLGICRKELRKDTFIKKLFSKKEVYTVNGDYTDIHNETMEKYMEYDTMEENRTEPDDDFVDYLHQCEMEAVNLNENQIIYGKELEEDIER